MLDGGHPPKCFAASDCMRAMDSFESIERRTLEESDMRHSNFEPDEHRLSDSSCLSRYPVCPLYRRGSKPCPQELGNHSVDAVLPGHVPAAEEEFESQPPAEADDHRIRDVPWSSGVRIGQQLAILVDSVDAVLPGHVPAAEEELEVQPSAEADDHWIRDIPLSSGVCVGQQLAILVDSVDAVLPGHVPAAEEELEVQPPAKA